MMARKELRRRPEECGIETVEHTKVPGNALVLEIEAEHVTEVFTVRTLLIIRPLSTIAEGGKSFAGWLAAA